MAEVVRRGGEGRGAERGPDRVGGHDRKCAERRHEERELGWIGVVEEDRSLGKRRVLHREERARVGHRGRGTGRDKPGRRVQRDEVIARGLGRPGDERDEPRRGRKDRGDGDSGYAPPTVVMSIPR